MPPWRRQQPSFAEDYAKNLTKANALQGCVCIPQIQLISTQFHKSITRVKSPKPK